MHAIEIKNLLFGYNSEKIILKKINLNIPYNKYICILGHNGSGKSTLSKLLSGLEFAIEGEIKICGITVNKLNIQKILNKIGLVFQNPDNQFIGITPFDDIAFGLENRKVPAKLIKKITLEIANFLNLNKILHHNANLLSAGQKQKVAIASTLANNPDIIIFDESTSMLDNQNKKEIQDIMINLVKNENKTIISITHDMEELLIADYIIILKNGKIVFQGEDKNVFNDSNFLKNCNLNLPFIYGLKEELAKENIKIKDFKNENELIKKISKLI